PASDAIRVRDFLRDEADFDYVVTLTDDKATYTRINNLMENVFPTSIGPNDRFLFYFSGHGTTRHFGGGGSVRGYLALKQAGHTDWTGMIDMPRVRQWTENLQHTRHTLFILDACFSGLAAFEPKSTPRDKTIERLMQPGHHIITAGSEGEESYIFRGESLFTQAFLSAARGEDNEVGDGLVSLSEIMTRINRTLDARRSEIGDRLKMTPRQYYSRITNNAGEFFFLSLRLPVISNMGRMRLTNVPDAHPASEAIAAETNLAPKRSKLFTIKPNLEIKQLTSAP